MVAVNKVDVVSVAVNSVSDVSSPSVEAVKSNVEDASSNSAKVAFSSWESKSEDPSSVMTVSIVSVNKESPIVSVSSC